MKKASRSGLRTGPRDGLKNGDAIYYPVIGYVNVIAFREIAQPAGFRPKIRPGVRGVCVSSGACQRSFEGQSG